MQSDFAALILTHGRPDRVHTYFALRNQGFTGQIIIVIDNEDQKINEYKARYGDAVVVFDKAAASKTFDVGDNFKSLRGVIYARNASFQIAKDLGFRYFIQLDDDYTGFEYCFDEEAKYGYGRIKNLDKLFKLLVNYLEVTPFASIAISQGGDHIGGSDSKKTIGTKRKAMNSFVCDVNKPFKFVGRINEDVNVYTYEQRKGLLFLTILGAKLVQKVTQSNAGGMTDLYIDNGTYVKTFYSIIYAPSCVKVAELSSPQNGNAGHSRIHHRVNWRATAPLIISEKFKKVML